MRSRAVAEAFIGFKFPVSNNTGPSAMNTFYQHHKDSIKFGYRCFDRILLNGLIQPFQQPERVIGFFNAYRDGQRVTRNRRRDIAEQFQNWVKNRSEKWGSPILEAPEGRRDDLSIAIFASPRVTSSTESDRHADTNQPLADLGRWSRLSF
jgi:hypothetical protein